MTITGLESDYYCVHNPIPIEVTVTSDEFEVSQLRVTFGDDPETSIYRPIFYSFITEGSEYTFRIDLSRWVRQYMANFEEIYTYTTTPTTQDQPYTTPITINFEAVGTEETDTVTRTFVHCALDSYSLEEDDDPFCCVKIWQCYPFSSPFDGWDSRVLVIPTGDGNICSTIPFVCGKYDFDISCCKGAYLKWLNDKGYYSYWLFPNFKIRNREGKEIDRKPRSVFNTSRTSNEDTAGFDVTEVLTIRDIIPKPYWPTLRSLVGSPEVYILRPSWEPGTDDTATPKDWIKIIQNKPEFETDAKFNTAEFEMDFDPPKVYTQKRC